MAMTEGKLGEPMMSNKQHGRITSSEGKWEMAQLANLTEVFTLRHLKKKLRFLSGSQSSKPANISILRQAPYIADNRPQQAWELTRAATRERQLTPRKLKSSVLDRAIGGLRKLNKPFHFHA